MTFTPSAPPDITEGLPALMSARQASQVAVNSGARFDVYVGGVGFVMDCDEQHPYVRQSAPVTKDQFDTSKEAGEQSLDGWWLRSQTSWHHGSGVRFYEPGSDEASQFRSETTVGVNVWERDQATLLNSMKTVGSADGNQTLCSTVLPNGHGALFVQGTSGLSRIEFDDGVPGTPTAYTGKTPTTKPTVAGQTVLSSTATAIVKGSVTGDTLADLWTQTSGEAPQVYWVKDRIIATRGADVFELTLTGGDLDAQTAVFTHPDSDWTWTCVAEHPSGILLSGSSGGNSTIYLMTIDTSQDPPVLAAPAAVAQFPFGERVQVMHTYLGAYVGIGTTRGVRVGVMDQNGLSYGPLTIETDSAVLDLASSGTFLWATITNGIDGKSGVARIDLSGTIGQGLQFPWAWDVQTHQSGVCRSVAICNYAGVVACAVDGLATYVEDVSTPESQGYILTGRIRFGTVEPKSFQSVDVDVDTGDGSVTVGVLPATADVPSSLGTLGATNGAASLGFALNDPQQWVQLKLTLHKGDTAQPVLRSWQVKALPKPKSRQRMYQYPLLCFDRERNARSNLGGQDFSWKRIQALEELEQKAPTVQVQDLTNGETFTAVVDQVQFERVVGRADNGDGNFGGRVTLTVRRVA